MLPPFIFLGLIALQVVTTHGQKLAGIVRFFADHAQFSGPKVAEFCD